MAVVARVMTNKMMFSADTLQLPPSTITWTVSARHLVFVSFVLVFLIIPLFWYHALD